MNVIEELMKPFPENAIHWRVGATNKAKDKCIPLAYINARDVMERLDFVVGAQNWQDRYPREGCCELGIKLDGEWVWKSDGAGQTDIEGEKGQYSDAFKRAAVKFGVARYLYDLPNTWVPYTGDKYKPFTETPKLPAWATPNGWNRIPAAEKREFYAQMVECITHNDKMGVDQLFSEYSNEQIATLWGMFNSQQRSAIKAIREDK